MEVLKNNGAAYLYCVEKMQRDPDVIDLANRNLSSVRKDVNDYVCDELVELKKKYSVDTLEEALEMESADLECARLFSEVVMGGVLPPIIKRL